MIVGVAKTLPKNADIADQFDLLADFLELEGSDQFRPLAYRRAAQRMRETGGSIAQLAVDGKAKQLSGIGKTIEEKIVQIVEDGRIEALAKREQRVPADVVEFMHLPGLGPKTARRIWQELGVETLDDLRKAAESERLRTLTGLGPKTEENVLKALSTPRKKIERKPLLGQALPAVRAVVEVLREHPAADQVSEAGSVRRLKEQVRDLDIIATASDPKALIAYFTELAWVEEIVAKGNTKATVVANDGLRFDLRVVPPESYGNLLQHFTGSKQHNVALREEAVRRKLSVSEYGIQDTESGEVFTDKTEETMYERLGYPWIPPELRENMGELQAAREGAPAPARRARGYPRRSPLPLDLVAGREEHDRGDGARGEAARALVPRRHRPLALPARGADRGAEPGDRQGPGETQPLQASEGDRGQHPDER